MTPHLDTQIAAALDRLGRRAPTPALDPSLVRRAVQRRRMMLAGPVAAVLMVVAILAGVMLSRPHGSSPATPAASACAPLRTGPVPTWARAGFTGNHYPPFTYSSSGDVVAIVFGDPLSAPPAADHNNKILWVVRGDDSNRFGATPDFAVTAYLEGSDRATTLRIPQGPSIVDMPAAGCWQLDLHWGDRTDTVYLRWQAP